MPLIQSKTDTARSENIAKEVSVGKDPKQAAAIAYSVQRANDGDPVRQAFDALDKLACDCMAVK